MLTEFNFPISQLVRCEASLVFLAFYSTVSPSLGYKWSGFRLS